MGVSFGVGVGVGIGCEEGLTKTINGPGHARPSKGTRCMKMAESKDYTMSLMTAWTGPRENRDQVSAQAGWAISANAHHAVFRLQRSAGGGTVRVVQCSLTGWRSSSSSSKHPSSCCCCVSAGQGFGPRVRAKGACLHSQVSQNAAIFGPVSAPVYTQPRHVYLPMQLYTR